MKINLKEKLFYNIGEVAEAFNVNPSLIRYWEKEFEILKNLVLHLLMLQLLFHWQVFFLWFLKEISKYFSYGVF